MELLPGRQLNRFNTVLMITFSLLWGRFARADEPTNIVGQSPGAMGSRSGAGAGNIMNPEISLDGLFSASQFNRSDPVIFNTGHDPKGTGFTLQQVEMAFNSAVDPYFKAHAYLVLSPEGIEVEEAYATTQALPAGFQVRAGSFFTNFGRNNPTHPHGWDFLDKPLVLGRFFGGDGLRNPGAEASWLLPTPFFSELLVSLQNSTGETLPSFRPEGSPATKSLFLDSATLLRTNNFVSLSDELGLNFGASYLTGPNSQGSNKRTTILGGDVYLKYKGDGFSYVSLQIEVLKRFYDLKTGTAKDWGWYAQTVYRLPGEWEKWIVGLRYDWVNKKAAPVVTASQLGNPDDPDTAKRFRIAPVVSFHPTEFSKIRFQYDYDFPENFARAEQEASLQFEFLIGAHGAHRY
jgi:hypothetical protein